MIQMGQYNHQDPYKYKRAAEEEVRVFSVRRTLPAIAGFGGGGRVSSQGIQAAPDS